jgi:hypothetical protein
LADLHAQSWFKLDASDSIVESKRGTRQGCRFGSLLFALVYGAAVKDTRQHIEALRLPVKVACASEAIPWAYRDLPTDGHTQPYDTTYADDEAIFLLFDDWEHMHDKLPEVMQVVEAHMLQWGFKLNWAAGKSEILAIFAGPGSRGAQEAFRATMANLRSPSAVTMLPSSTSAW